MKDYRVTVKVRNNRILRAIEESGGSPGQKWCDANGLGYTRVNDFINMTSGPFSASGDLYPDALRLCEVLNKIPQDLWSNEQLYPLEKNFSELNMDYSQVVSMLPTCEKFYINDFSGVEQEETKKLLWKAISTLTQREQEVIRMRFTDEITFDECAEILGLSKERVRQIEVKALRKLRHPSRIGIFVDALDITKDQRDKYKAEANKYQDR